MTTVLTLFMVPSISGAADWLYFMQNRNGNIYYIDLESIERTESGKIHISGKIQPANSSQSSVILTDMEMDCGKKRTRILKETSPDKNSKDRTVKEKGWQSADEDMNELLLELVCSLKKPNN